MDNRQIDKLVAQYVMGWGIHKRNTAWWVDKNEVDAVGGSPFAFTDEWQPSTDIAAAWQVVEKMGENYTVLISLYDNSLVSFDCKNQVKVKIYRLLDLFEAVANTAPLAICLAALKAVGVEVN